MTCNANVAMYAEPGTCMAVEMISRYWPLGVFVGIIIFIFIKALKD